MGNRKCGSSTLDTYFSQYQEMPYKLFSSKQGSRFFDATHFDGKALSKQLSLILMNTYPKHYNAYQIKNLFDFLNWDWNQYLKIVVIRNPWARMLSDYMWYLKNLSNSILEFTTPKKFEIFLMSYKRMYFDCLSHFTNVFDESYEDNKIHIIKLEELNLEIPKIMKTFAPDLVIQEVPNLNQTKHPLYADCYTPQAKNIVKYAFASDIKYGGYEF